MNEAFVGKVAVVTGAARGSGRPIAEGLYAVASAHWVSISLSRAI